MSTSSWANPQQSDYTIWESEKTWESYTYLVSIGGSYTTINFNPWVHTLHFIIHVSAYCIRKETWSFWNDAQGTLKWERISYFQVVSLSIDINIWHSWQLRIPALCPATVNSLHSSIASKWIGQCASKVSNIAVFNFLIWQEFSHMEPHDDGFSTAKPCS